MNKSDEQREQERKLRESIQLGMVSGDLPDVDCPACGFPIEYDVYRENGRIISLATNCPCGYSKGAIHGI